MKELNALLTLLKDKGKSLDGRVLTAALSILRGEKKPEPQAGVNVVINLLSPQPGTKQPTKQTAKPQPQDDILSQAVNKSPMKRFVDKIASA